MSLSLDPLPQHRGGSSAKRPRVEEEEEEDEDAVADEAENRIQRAIDAAASTRKPRKRKKKKPVWPEGVDVDDAFPANGRFSQEQEDDFDRQCVQRPLTAALTFENKQALRADAVERIRQRSMRSSWP